MNEPVYHIYAKDRCLYNCLKQAEFEEKWEMLNIMVGLMKTDYDADDLTCERLAPGMGGHNPDIFPEPSGGDSY